MLSPFQQAAPSLRTRGYSIIPLAPGLKYPVIGGWSEYCSRLPTEEEMRRWMGWRDSNAGLCLGSASGVMALDFDDDVDGMHARIRSIIPDSPAVKRGAKGFTAFYRHNGQRSHGYGVGGIRVLDVLSDGRQTVLPPSLHPSGVPYHWISRQTLADLRPDELPELSPAAMSAIQALFRPAPAPAPAVRRGYHEPFVETTPHDIREALSFIPADDYDWWIRIGMALKQHLGDAGFALWDAWSSTSGKYDPKPMQVKWRSFRKEDVKIATLFYKAFDHGYIGSHTSTTSGLSVVILEGGNLKPVVGEGADIGIPISEPAPISSQFYNGLSSDIPDQPAPIPSLTEPPGLVGRIARWIESTAIYPQPLLATAAAISCAGAVMAHKIQSPTGLRTNFYALGLAPSGSGKDHARKCIMSLLRAAGMDGLLGGIPASGAGLLSAVRGGNGRCLILWDEFGKVLKSLTHKNAGSHQREIPTFMMELFTCADSVYAGIQYANHDGKMERKVIDQPCLSVYGTTVAENFYASLTKEDAIDGFLARWLVFESKEYSLDEREPEGRVGEPPNELVRELTQWKNAPSNCNPQGDLDAAAAIRPVTIGYTPGAEAMIRDFRRAMRARAIEQPALASIYARCAEHAIKLALVAHEGDVMGEYTMTWAIGAVGACSGFLIDAVGHSVAENDFERASNRILSIVGEGKGDWVSHKRLVDGTRQINARQRQEMVANLVDAERIEVETVKVEGTNRPSYRYRSYSV